MKRSPCSSVGRPVGRSVGRVSSLDGDCHPLERRGREGDRRSLDLDRLRYIIISESDDDECSASLPLAVCSAPLERSDEAIISFASADEREEGSKRVIRAI